MRSALLIATSILMILFSTPETARACACCADPGLRFNHEQEIDDVVGPELDKIRLAPDARLYTDAADWEEAILGFNNPDRSTDYAVTLARDAGRWTVTFADAKGNSGSIVVTLPERIEIFAADPTPGDGSGTNTTLYKEWRLSGPMYGTGMFELRTRGLVRPQFIFHGRGNGCTFAEQFTHWTLDVNGPGARYRFFGRLDPAKN